MGHWCQDFVGGAEVFGVIGSAVNWESDETRLHPDSGSLVPTEQQGMKPNSEDGTLAC